MPNKSLDDLAVGLFGAARAEAGLASIVRDLQQRNRAATNRPQQQIPPEPVVAQQNPKVAQTQEARPHEAGNLWVMGGATTVADLQGGEAKATAADAPAPLTAPAESDSAPPTPADEETGKQEGAGGVVLVLGDPRADALRTALEQPPEDRKGVRGCCAGTLAALKEVGDIIRLYPFTLMAPLTVFMLLTGLGIWGVIAGAHSHVQQRKDDARSRAVDSATGFQIQLQQAFAPGITFPLLVKQRPQVEYWWQQFNATATELMSQVPAGALFNIQLQPFAQVMMIWPMRPGDETQTDPPRDLVADPTRRDDIFRIIKSKEPLVVGPVTLYDGSIGAFIRYPIYIADVDENETFGFRYKENTSALPYSGLPAAVRGCTVCYNATTRTKWWGLLSALVDYNAVTLGQDAYLANLRRMNFYYSLVRPINATAEQVIAQVGPSALRDEEAVTVEVKVLNSVWLLRVAPQAGFQPSWRDPLIAAVVFIALIISLLLFVAMASFKRQRLLLQGTVAANRNLAETTKRLEEEKERMDLLLLRQYDLLRCLDANRPDDGKLNSSDAAVNASKRAMMARIEDARRSLNVATASIEDPIQVFELLGAGAFGKVQRGLWRGTVVAVKTMILPANMTGQLKREKMAVMEAAISSSLVHPNIVTTYTYFIRPYHEPSHSGVRNMLANSGQPGSPVTGSEEGGSLNDSAESTIHSYEVRLVLEFCDKGSLKDALDQQAFLQAGALNLCAMLETAADVAKAMVHMHAANVLHSDLKARNIMLKSSGTEGRGIIAKVADFGLSTRMEHQETHLSSCFQGTLTHMAPEVMMEGRISKAADVYSFGILLWELFCASDPFAGVPRAHLGHAITKEAHRPKFPPFAPRTFVALASRCWDPEAAQRPSFAEVLTELLRIRDELGGDTPALVILPPRPLTPQGSGSLKAGAAGGSRSRGSPADGGGGGYDNGGGGGGSGSTLGMGSGIVLMGGGTSTADGSVMGSLAHSALAHRALLKGSAVQRQMRKMGLRVGGGGGSSGGSLPALQEEAEHNTDAERAHAPVLEEEGEHTEV